MVLPSERPPSHTVEECWLAWHDNWMRSLKWLTAWWNICVAPASGHHTLHAPKIAPGGRLAVPEPIARDTEQDLFA